MKCILATWDLDQLCEFPAGSDFLISPSFCSRFGKLSINQATELAQKVCSLGVRPILEWDILMTSQVFEQTLKQLHQMDLSLFAAIRVQDPGALQWCIKNTDLALHYIAETGHHNLLALQTILKQAPGRIQRLVISPELSKETVKSYVEQLPVELELLALGQILLFYTPRNLLSPYEDEFHEDHKVIPVAQRPWIEAQGTSEESPHKGFPLLENQHGTFMFNTKDLCLLDVWQDVLDTKIAFVRFDGRYEGSAALMQMALECFKSQQACPLEKIKSSAVRTVTKGFFKVNKTHVLFSKLKNSRLQQRDENYLGDILECVKGEYMALQMKSTQHALQVGQHLKLLTPEGKEKSVQLSWLKDCAGKALEHFQVDSSHGGIVLLPHVSGSSIRSQLFLP